MSAAQWYLDGRLRAPADVRLSPDDVGLLQGDGLFETLRVDGGAAVDLPAHLDRLFAGLATLAIAVPESRGQLAEAAATVAASAADATARLRITVTRGVPAAQPTRLIQVASYRPLASELQTRGVDAVVWRRAPVSTRDPFRRLKSLSYQLEATATREAHAAGAWEAVLLNQEGRLAEGSRSNLILVREGRLVTPPVEEGCLPGTVRRRLLEAGAVEQDRIELRSLEACGGLLLTNSLVGVVPVHRLDGVTLPPVAQLPALREALAARQRGAR